MWPKKHYLRYTDTGLYLSQLAHGINAKTAYDAAEITVRASGHTKTAIATHNGTFIHLALVQVCEGVTPEWITLCSASADQPRIPSVWCVIRWAESASEIDDDPADYLGVFDEYELF